MGNPVLIEVPIDNWVKVAESITAGRIWISKMETRYYHTYRLTGQAAPVSLEEGIPILNPFEDFDFSKKVDIYLFCKGRGASIKGKVRFDSSLGAANDGEGYEQNLNHLGDSTNNDLVLKSGGTFDHEFVAPENIRIPSLTLSSPAYAQFDIYFDRGGVGYKYFDTIFTRQFETDHYGFDDYIELKIGEKIKITKTNRDNNDQSIYSSIHFNSF